MKWITTEHCRHYSHIDLSHFELHSIIFEIDKFPSSIKLYSTIRFHFILYIFGLCFGFCHVLFYDISVYRIQSHCAQSTIWTDSEIQFILYNDIALKIWMLLETHEHATQMCERSRAHSRLFVCSLYFEYKAIRPMGFVSTKWRQNKNSTLPNKIKPNERRKTKNKRKTKRSGFNREANMGNCESLAAYFVSTLLLSSQAFLLILSAYLFLSASILLIFLSIYVAK